MDEMLQEFIDSRGARLRVDRERSVIRGVKLLGLESRNGRRYLPGALAQAAPLYDDAKVNVNHPKGHPLAARDYQDRLGVVRGVAFRDGEGLYGDLHFNPKHALAEQLQWDAEHAPENLGLSHNVQARTSRQGEQTLVEAILKVNSVDLVADPASTQGLFEARAISPLTVEQLRLERPDLYQEIQEAAAGEITSLRSELDQLRARHALHERRAAAIELLREFKLPEPGSTDPMAKAITSDVFMGTLLAASDPAAMRALVEERAAALASVGRWPPSSVVTSNRPQSREQSPRESAAMIADAAAFARAIR